MALTSSTTGLAAGDLVEVLGMRGSFAGFRVVADSAMHRRAGDGHIWVREIRGLVERPTGWEPFTIEWPASSVVKVW